MKNHKIKALIIIKSEKLEIKNTTPLQGENEENYNHFSWYATCW